MNDLTFELWTKLLIWFWQCELINYVNYRPPTCVGWGKSYECWCICMILGLCVLLWEHSNCSRNRVKCFRKGATHNSIFMPALFTFIRFSLLSVLPFCSSVPHLWVCGIQTVELSDCEKTQALALRVLLSLSRFNQHRIHEMDCYHGYSMIHQVLIKSKCIVGYHMLKVSHTLNSLLSSVPTTSADLCNKTYSPPLVFVFHTMNLIQPDTLVPLWDGVCDPAVTWPSGCVCNWAVWWLCAEMDSVWLDETLSSCRVTQRLWSPLSL